MKTDIAQRKVRPFIEEFERQRANTTSNLDAYEKTEMKYEEIVGFRRYSDYESFRRVRVRRKNR